MLDKNCNSAYVRQQNTFADQLLKGGKRHFPYLLLLTSEAVYPIKLYGVLAQIHLSLGKMANALYPPCVKMNKKTWHHHMQYLHYVHFVAIYIQLSDFKRVLLDWLGVQCCFRCSVYDKKEV